MIQQEKLRQFLSLREMISDSKLELEESQSWKWLMYENDSKVDKYV